MITVSKNSLAYNSLDEGIWHTSQNHSCIPAKGPYAAILQATLASDRTLTLNDCS